ncbi:hypothetical protein ACFSBS_17295, partial [Azospirillum griseum]
QGLLLLQDNPAEHEIPDSPVLGPTLCFHTDQAQAAETAIGTAALNPMLDLGPPNSVRLTGSAVGRGDLRNSSPRCNTPTRA